MPHKKPQSIDAQTQQALLRKKSRRTTEEGSRIERKDGRSIRQVLEDERQTGVDTERIDRPSTDGMPASRPLSETAGHVGLCQEDWLIIDEALHRVARSLRKIEREKKRNKLEEVDEQPPANQ